MHSMNSGIRKTATALTFLVGFASHAFGQLNSTASTVALTATLVESVTVAVTPAAAAFVLVPGGTATAVAPVAITTTWVVATGRANLVLDAYFASASAALSTSGPPVVNIPSSAVWGQVTTGTPTSFTAFTQTAALGPAGGGLSLLTVALTTSNRVGVRTDNLNLEINLSSQGQIPAAIYTGTLYVAAQAL